MAAADPNVFDGKYISPKNFDLYLKYKMKGMKDDLKPQINASTGKISVTKYIGQLLDKIKRNEINQTKLSGRKDFESIKEYIDYLLKIIVSHSNASNSNTTADKKGELNAYVFNQRLRNQQGYKNNTSAMRDLRKKLVEISTKIYYAKEKNGSANTFAMDTEKQQLLNQLSKLESRKNSTGGRRTHKKRYRTYTRRRSN
jgi:hypothetical protein